MTTKEEILEFVNKEIPSNEIPFRYKMHVPMFMEVIEEFINWEKQNATTIFEYTEEFKNRAAAKLEAFVLAEVNAGNEDTNYLVNYYFQTTGSFFQN